jgi:hypothetical protein
MKRRRLVIAAIVVVGVLIWMGLDMYTKKRNEKHPLGLKLVAKYEPLQLYIYADTASTSKSPDYLICE